MPIWTARRYGVPVYDTIPATAAGALALLGDGSKQ
jgi:hypothetical protein